MSRVIRTIWAQQSALFAAMACEVLAPLQVGEQITAAERQGLTLDYLGGWHTFKPDRKALARAWRVLYNVPDSMIDLFTGPQERWEQVVLRWLRHHPDQSRPASW